MRTMRVREPAVAGLFYPAGAAELEAAVKGFLGEAAGSEAELLSNLEVGRDGVLIRSGAASATFLPAMWDKVPDALEFLRHLARRRSGSPPGSTVRSCGLWSSRPPRPAGRR